MGFVTLNPSKANSLDLEYTDMVKFLWSSHSDTTAPTSLLQFLTVEENDIIRYYKQEWGKSVLIKWSF